MPRTPAATMAADPERAAHGAVAHLARPGASAVSAAVCSDKPILFLDFEASSLTAGSWPVEIGYARIADGRVVVEAALIAPEAAWSMDDWSEAAARLHGLSIEAVRCGRPAAEIAARTDRFRDFLVVSDNPAWDQWWLDRLRSGRLPILVHDLRALAAVRLSETAADIFAMQLLRTDGGHRAGSDAARLAGAWLAATRWEALAA